MAVCDYASLVTLIGILLVPATVIQPIQNTFFLMIVIKEIKGHLRSHDV
jgi:hypothetical protein